ncbi:M4 family metallopeptidase [Streptomyces sp. NPDC005955]|uniref:M4 family metallopeptidase n=1 Tax=Streptomyces sp. NPDC005955 TaxID=3364738 RepID=UPI0036B9F6D7
MRRISRRASAAGALLAGVALIAVAVPSGTAGAAPVGSAPTAPQPRAGALPVKLDPQRQAALLSRAEADRVETAAALGLGRKERLLPRNVLQDADGTVHTRYERTYEGLPVLGGDLVVHTTPSGAIEGATRATRARVAVPRTTAARSATAAGAFALAKAESEGTERAELPRKPRAVIWAASGRPVLAWESVVHGTQSDSTPSEYHVITDATTGAELYGYEAVKRHDGVGHSRHSGQVTLGTSRFGSFYNLTDTSRGSHRTYDLTGLSAGDAGRGKLFTDSDGVWGDGTSASRQTDAVDAAYGAQATWDYFAEVHGRYGIRNDGDGASARVHYLGDYHGAYWQDSCFCVTYGGGGTTPYTSIDMTAHELAHGLISDTAKLNYYGESGGIAEATGDIFAAAVEFHAGNSHDAGDYTTGEKVDVGSANPPLRHMDRPAKRDRSTNYWHPRFDSSTNIGYMAGPATHWFYLVAEGSGAKTVNGVSYDSPTHDGLPVTGIGRAAAERIWYRALTLYMTSTTDYLGARAATLAAAADLYGADSAVRRNVMDAWGAVNVGARPDNPAPRPPGPVFTNNDDVPLPALPAAAESPITVTGVPGKAPTILLVDLHTVGDPRAALELVAPDGTAYPLANGFWMESSPYIATLGVDASAETANGTWKLRARAGAYSYPGAYINSWTLSF